MDGDRARAAAAGSGAAASTTGAPAPRPGTGSCRAASDRTGCLRRAHSGTARTRDQAAASLDARVEHPPAARIGGCRLIPKLYVAPGRVDRDAGLAYVSAEGSFLAPTLGIRFGCGHSSTRGGSRTGIERRSAGGILPRPKAGAGSCFPALAVQVAAHPEHAAIIRSAPSRTYV